MPNIKNQSKINFEPNNASFLNKFLWLRRNFFYCLAVSTLIWFTGVGYYIENFIGWSSVFSLNPADFSVFLLAATLPIIAIWFVLAYIERSSSIDANAELLASYIDSLMYPDDVATQSAKAFANVLQKQAEKLQNQNKAVVEQSVLMKNDLEGKIAELAKILQLLDNYSGKTLLDLNDGVKTLADRCKYITDRTTNSISVMRECSTDIKQNADVFLSKINPLLDEISAVSSNVKSNIAVNSDSLLEIKKILEDSAAISQNHLDVMLAKTSENTVRIQEAFYKTAEECDVLYKRMDTSISSIEGRVEDQKRLISKQSSVIEHNSNLLNNKLAKYGKDISVEIDKLVKNSVTIEKETKKQIGTLKAVNVEAGKAISNLSDTFNEKRAELERRCEYAVNSMQNVIIAINKETDKLMAFTNLTQAKNLDLQNVTETIVDKIGDVSAKMALKTDELKNKAVEVIDSFMQAQEIINKNTEKLNKSSANVVNSGKEGVKLWEEQNFYVNNAITNIEVLSKKLDALRNMVKESSEEMDRTISHYEKQISKYEEIKKPNLFIDSSEPEFNKEKVMNVAMSINKTLFTLGIKADKMFAGCDIFDLWDEYLKGNNGAFLNVLANRLSRRQALILRKSFDDNIEFHNLVIRYLFLIDIMIKNLQSSTHVERNEMLNFSVNNGLDKIYFVLVKALNSAV